MGFVNKVMLLGNTTREAQLRELPTGTHVCDFGLATNRVYKNAGGEERQETAFVDCTAFGRMAEIVAEYCPKGRQLFVEGRLHFETWEDRDGNRRSKLSVIAENIQFVGSRLGPEDRQHELPPDTARNGKAAPEKNGTTPAKKPAKARADDHVADKIGDAMQSAVDVDDLPF